MEFATLNEDTLASNKERVFVPANLICKASVVYVLPRSEWNIGPRRLRVDCGKEAEKEQKKHIVLR